MNINAASVIEHNGAVITVGCGGLAVRAQDCQVVNRGDYLCFLEQTLAAIGPFYLVSMAEEVKDPTQENGKPVVDSVRLEISNSKLTIVPLEIRILLVCFYVLSSVLLDLYDTVS